MWKSLEELVRETRKELLQKASPEERLEGLTAEDLLKALSPEVRAALAQQLKEDETSERPE